MDAAWFATPSGASDAAAGTAWQAHEVDHAFLSAAIASHLKENWESTESRVRLISMQSVCYPWAARAFTLAVPSGWQAECDAGTVYSVIDSNAYG